jgi:hypothetical protein
VRRKLENRCPGLQGVLLLLVLPTTSSGRLICRLAVPCFREQTWPAIDVGISIAFHLSLARGINQLGPFALMKEDVFAPYSIHETGLCHSEQTILARPPSAARNKLRRVMTAGACSTMWTTPDTSAQGRISDRKSATCRQSRRGPFRQFAKLMYHFIRAAAGGRAGTRQCISVAQIRRVVRILCM